ncbi:MAG: type II secretion system F family protein [Chlamydiae bacterium]|nr:type II secretion system F family protein [Chlamydiota bacterium]
MALFEYLAILENGKKTKGSIDADSLQDAKILLQLKNLAVIDIKQFVYKDKKFSKKEILMFTEELAKLLSAKLPLYEALLALGEKYDNNPLKELILDLQDKVKSGDSLSSALKNHPKNFDIIFCSMVENAEKNGGLEGALLQISIMLKKELQIKKQIVSSLSYPGLLLVFCMIVLTALFFFVIPGLFDLFEGRELHPFTQIIFSISHFAISFKAYLATAFILFIGLIIAFFSLPLFKKKIIGLITRLPLIHPFMLKIALIRFFRSFSTLLASGESYVNGINLAINVITHPELERELKKLSSQLNQGKKLSDLIKNISIMPPLVYRMMAVAEEASNMEVMLNHMADIYEDELEKKLAQITVMIQPIMLLILGAIVGLVVLSVLLPLTDVSSFAGN